MGMIGYFAEIDSEKINQLLESTEKALPISLDGQ